MTNFDAKQIKNKVLNKKVKLKKKKTGSLELTTPLSRIKKQLGVLKSIVFEFCSTTTFHGIRYITEEHRHWIERFLWTAISVMGVASAAVLINTVWAKYSTSPTITSVESTHYPIWNIPFPAVTICNVNKVHLSLAVEIYQKLFSKILEEREYWAFISQMAEIIQPEEVDMMSMNIEHLRTALKLRNHTIGTLMVLLTQPCSTLMVKCRWRGLVVPCSDLFTLQRTDSGYCCSFNYFPIGSDKRLKPRHVNGAGYLAGLSVLLDPQLEDYYASLFSFYGVQVMVHSPREYPEISARGNIIAPKKEVFLQVSGASTYSTPEVRALSLEQRMCLFEDEHILDMDPTPDGSGKYKGEYSYTNCLVQCRMRHMMKLCNCTPYFYTMKTITKGLCRLAEVPCLVKYRRVFNNLRPPDPVPGLEDNHDAMTCDCQPTCSEVSYNTEQSEADFFKSSYDTTNFFKGVNVTNHSIVHVYFKDLSVLRFRRDVIYTWNDLLASFGGIVGLCLGSSLISFVELFYYFTVRPACELLRNCEKQHQQHQQQQQQQQHQQQQHQQQQQQNKQHAGQILRSIKIMPAVPQKIPHYGPPFDWII